MTAGLSHSPVQPEKSREMGANADEVSRGSPGVSLPTLVGGASPTILPPEHVVACTSPACARLMSQGDYLRKRRRGWVGHEFWGKSLRVNESLTALFM